MKVYVIVGYVLEFFAAAPSDPPSEYKRAAFPPPDSFIPSFPSNFLVSLHFDAIAKMIPAESDLVRSCDDGHELHVNTGVKRTRKAGVTVSNSSIASS
jgi:hypothetical protein